MVKIKLSNFRKWDSITFDLGDGITKITGESGMGKSTIFEAIYWCLYGRVRSVAPKHSVESSIKSGRTEVILELPYTKGDIRTNMQIHRTGQKNVTVLLGDEQYTGEIAQSKIDEYFGCHEMFLMASYLRAESSHPLISATPSEKRELTSLIFPDASKYDRYKAKLLEIRRSDEYALSQVRNNILSSKSSISTLEESNSWLLSTPILDTSLADEKTIQSSIATAKKNREEATRILTTYEFLKKQLSSLPEPMDISLLEEEISQLKSKLTQSAVNTMTKDSKIKFLQERLEHESKLLHTLLISLGHQTLTIMDCTHLISVCDELLSISNSSSELDERIKNVDDEYSRQTALLCKYEKSLNDIEYNMKLENVLECPACHAKLQHTDKLVLFTGDTQHRHVEHNVTPGDVQKIHIAVDKLEDERKRLVRLHNRYQDILSREDQKGKGISLRNVDLKPYRSKLNEYVRVYKEKELFEKELQSVQEDTREYITKEEKAQIDARISELNTQISKSTSIEYSRKNIKDQIESIEKQTPWVINPSDYLKDIDSQLAQLQEDLTSVRQLKEKVRIQKMYLHHKKILQDNQKEMERLEIRISDAHKLEHILASSYNDYVGEKLKEIEYDVCLLGKYFFDDTMNITLTPGKETLTGGVKPSFDINVEYAGTVFEDVKAMSTGERKRLSIILMIVLTKYTDGRIMLLDEAFTSVGLESRGLMMSEIQKLGIPVYVTCHDEISGYTGELNLNQISDK